MLPARTNPYIKSVAFGGTTTHGDAKAGGVERVRLGLRRRGGPGRAHVLLGLPRSAATSRALERAAALAHAGLRIRVPHRHAAARGQGGRGGRVDHRHGPWARRPRRRGRRRRLSTLPLSIAAVSVGALALRLTPDWYAAIFLPPGSGRRGVSPAVTPVENFYVVSKNFVDPQVDGGSWRLKVAGMVEKSLSLSLDDLRGLPASEQYTTMACISNLVGGDQISSGKFKGVPLRDLIASAGPQAQAGWVGFKARDGYTESLPLSVGQGSPESLGGYALTAGPGPRSAGFPARVLIPGRYGMKAPKWLDEIDLVGGEVKGYWEQQGWDHDAVVRTMSRIDTPEDGDIVPIGTIEVAGVAFAGTRGVSKVEYSTDGGSHWSVAQFDAPLSRLTWVIWRATWTPGSHGAYTLKVRTTDGAGALQDSADSPSFPSGSKGYHTVHVNVTG